MYESKVLEFQYKETNLMSSDIFTKAFANPQEWNDAIRLMGIVGETSHRPPKLGSTASLVTPYFCRIDSAPFNSAAPVRGNSDCNKLVPNESMADPRG
jgi:hypothetical protein